MQYFVKKNIKKSSVFEQKWLFSPTLCKINPLAFDFKPKPQSSLLKEN